MSAIFTGAAEGASAGSAAGPYGALVGAVVGGLVGLGADNKMKRARKYVRKANALRTDATILRSYAEQRTLLRQANLVRMANLANSQASGAELDSSGNQGVQASIRTQAYDNYLLGNSILNQQLDANYNEAKAGQQVAQSGEIMSAFGAVSQLSQLIPTKKAVPYDPRSAPSLQNAFDTSLVNPGGIQTISGDPYNA